MAAAFQSSTLSSAEPGARRSESDQLSARSYIHCNRSGADQISGDPTPSEQECEWHQISHKLVYLQSTQCKHLRVHRMQLILSKMKEIRAYLVLIREPAVGWRCVAPMILQGGTS
ncbi:hypothetical protein GOBAR_AA33777 [Gossypium barbadense]|uniref:Uncharacterized protein n=1 Tax=Gossypium barbadense TaxID=3634 RepID=A0A2P5W752_GOSBA|nr:hypothetical protein GOBAR_AA33777 [Gossypium barbadense]